MTFWGSHERQGNVTHVVIPEYQPSSATLVVGGNLYKPSAQAQNVAVGHMGLDAGTIVLIAIPVGIFLIWLLKRK